MADILVTSPFQPFTLPTQFKAVFNGYIYCGTVDAVDPSVSQVQVYLINESGDKVPVAQPLRTNSGGYLVYNGQPAKFVTDSNHSLLVQDSFHVQIWYAPDMASIDPEALLGELSGPDGAYMVGFKDTNVGRVLDSDVFIDYFAPVLDYGPIINTRMTAAYGGTIKLRGERYPVLTTIKRKAGWTIEGKGPYATELYWNGGSGALIENDTAALVSRNGVTIGNASGQYHTALKDLALIGSSGIGIGLWKKEGWWDRVERVIIDGFDIGEKDGFGTSNLTGNYWCKNDQVWYRNNRVNLHITDQSNLNTWANCRFSGATAWDVEFIEPATPQLLGMQGNRFVDCEFASPDSVYLGARIFDLNFHNPYFEQPGYAVYDGTNHSKGAVTFTGTPKIFGGASVKNKVVAGYNGGNCQQWAFHNIRTNLGKGAGAPVNMYVLDMGPTANYWLTIQPALSGVSGWDLTQPTNYNKLKMQLLDTQGKSILQMAKLSTESAITNQHHTTADYSVTNDFSVDMFRKGVSLGVLDATWQTVATIDDFVVPFAFAAIHCELTVSGRNPTFNQIHSANICFEVDSVNGALNPIVEVYNRQTGTSNVTVSYRAVVSGDVLTIQLNNTNPSPNNQYDQVFCAVDMKVVGRFTELCT